MGKFTVETCHIEGLKVITPTVFGDARGYFMETYNYNDFAEAGGLHRSALFALGAVLLLMEIAIQMLAERMLSERKH